MRVLPGKNDGEHIYIDPDEVAAIVDEAHPYKGCSIVLQHSGHSIRLLHLSASQVFYRLTTDAE